MKKWFNNLNKKMKNFVVFGLWICCVICFIFIGVIPEEKIKTTVLDDVIVVLCIVSLILSILFTCWKFKSKDNNNNQTGNKINNVKVNNVDNNVIKEEDLLVTRDLNHNFKYNYNTDKTYFYVDVETSNSHNDSVCSIGVIFIKNGEEKSFYSLINPKVHITNTDIHGISDADVINSPTIDKFWHNIEEYLSNEDFITIGHNISFDISVLKKDLERYNIDFNPMKRVDTMTIAKEIYYNHKTQSGDLKLSTLCDRLNVEIVHHNAESDIRATKNVLEILLTSKGLRIEDYINIHYSSKRGIIVNNIKNVKVNDYWEDIEYGRKPLYFTNWKKQNIEFIPKYDEVEIQDLLCTSMMNRESCEIYRVKVQVKLIKEFIKNLGGKCYNKGAKTAKSYIEFYYMDVQEYQKLKAQGYKILHGNDVEEFIANYNKVNK